jgi:L-asparaginase
MLSSEHVERRLAAILAADVVGSWRLIGIDERSTLAELKALRKTLFDPKIAQHPLMATEREINSMRKDTARAVSRRQSSISMLFIPVITFALWSCMINTAAQAAEAGTAANLPRILVLATGGTIAGQADPRATGAYKSGQITGEQLVQSVPGLDKLASFSAEQISSIGSQDMNDKVWFALARRIQQALDKNEADGVVVTHGTDTLEETAFFLDNVLHGDKPVVIVGSMRPATAVSADGPGNLYEAVQVAADPRSRGRGVMAVLNDKIEGARSVTKTNTTSIETFNSPNGGPIGYVDAAGGIRFMAQISGLKRMTYELPTNEQLPRVEIVYSHANMDAVPIEDAISHGAKGIVLAGVGDGNTSKQALDALEMAAKNGIIVVRSTRVRSGFVTRNVEVDDDKNGFVVSEDLSPQKARVLTQLLIASGVTAPAELQRAFTATW